MKTNGKTYLLLIFVLVCTTIFVASFLENQKFQNYERLLGKENPYVSKIKGDSIYLYQRTDSAMLFLDKLETQKKILLDLRVLKKNQAILETWLGIGVVINLIAIFLLARIFIMQRNK